MQTVQLLIVLNIYLLCPFIRCVTVFVVSFDVYPGFCRAMSSKSAEAALYDDLLYDSTINGDKIDLHNLFAYVAVQLPRAPRRYDDTCLLVQAARHGRKQIVEYLVEKRSVPVDSVGRMRIERGETSRATAAWIAAASNQIDVLCYLVDRGARPTYRNEFGESPLDIACKLGHIEIVRYLVETVGVPTETCNALGRTPFLTACAEGNVDLIRYLIHAGVDMTTATVESGGTCLHACSFVCGRVDAVRVLLEHGARPGPNRHGSPPVLDAAAMGHESVVEFWSDYYNLDDEMNAALVADAFALLGTAFWRKERDKAFRYFFRSFEIRRKHCVPDERFAPLAPVVAYGNAEEVTTIAGLHALRVGNDLLRLQKHCFMVRERILGPRHVTIARPCITFSYYLNRIGQEELVMPMWLYVLDRQIDDFMESGHSTLTYATLFTLAQSIQLPHLVVNPLPALERCCRIVAKLGPSHIRTWVFVEITMHYLSLYLHYAKTYFHENNADEGVKVGTMIRDFIQVVPLGPNGQTVLHYAVDARSTNLHLDSSLQMAVCQFPCPDTAKCLLSAGMNPNAADFKGNTPLHVAAESFIENQDQSPAKLEVVQLLLSAGAYAGARNASKATALYLATGDEDAKSELRRAYEEGLNLQRLAACAVVDHRLPHVGIIPAKLSLFVKMH